MLQTSLFIAHTNNLIINSWLWLITLKLAERINKLEIILNRHFLIDVLKINILSFVHIWKHKGTAVQLYTLLEQQQ